MKTPPTWDKFQWTFLPGLHGTDALYEKLCHKMPTQAEIELVNLPQKGKQTYNALAHWLGEHLDDSPNKPRILVAESFSGPLALHYAAQHPEKIAGIVLGASFCDAPINPGIALLPLRPLFMVKPPKRALAYFLAGEDASDEELSNLRQVIQSIPSATLTRRVRSVLELDPADAPNLKDIPMLILQADKDNLIPWDAQQRLESRYPHAQVSWLESPHLIFQRNPKECRKRLLEFADSLV